MFRSLALMNRELCRKFSDEEKRGKLVKTVAPVEDPDVLDVRATDGSSPAPVSSMRASPRWPAA